MNTTILDRLVSQPADAVARLDAAQDDGNRRTDTASNHFDNRPTWDNWNNR
jgi:hypothetical protein